MYLVWWWVVAVVWLALTAPAAAVVGGAPAAAPEPDAAVVFVQKNGLSARLEGLKDDRRGYYTFVGIRYAEPPLGPRRFQRPVRRFLAGEISAAQNCLPCPQPDPRDSRRVVGHEDCLCLNVYAPKMPGDEKGCPVVFFIHGGNYRSGSTVSYGGQHIAQKDTILVSAQYRLGSLGYFSTAQKDASGNAGLFDLHAAMSWINDYIEFFGGDPTRIVVMGQGSGGSAASLLALSSEGRSARGVAALSGTPLSPGAVRPDADPAKHARELANRTGCPETPVERLLMCLRKLPIEKLVQVDAELSMDMVDTKKFLDEISGRSGAGARVEGEDDLRALPPLVSEKPANALQKKHQKVPLLTGVTSAETSRAVFGKYSKFLTHKLATVEDFIKNELVGGLRGVVQGVEGLVPLQSTVNQVLPLADYYQALFDNTRNAVKGLTQIAEATGDALFNFPAYQSVQAWSTGSPAYLYSFEHDGNLTRGSHFLPGVPLAEDSTDNGTNTQERTAKGPAHGDDLAYIFEPLDDQGNPVAGEVSNTDARMRDSFVALIAKFAHELSLAETNNQSKPQLLNFAPFSKSNDQFMKIKDGDITLDKNFRFCEMGLWGNFGERVTGTICNDVIGKVLNLPKIPFISTVPGLTVPKLPSPKLPVPVLNNLLGSQTESPKVVQVTRPADRRRQGGLGSLFNRL